MCAAIISKAQVSKGNIVLGGNFSFTTSGYGDGSSYSTYFFVSPSLGKVYKENRIVGFNLNYGYNGNIDPDLRTSSYGAGFYLTQYKPLGKGFLIFLKESLNTYYSHLKNYSSTNQGTFISDNKSLSVGITINPGVAYDLSKKIQLELVFLNDLISAGYVHTKNVELGNPSNFRFEQNSFYASTDNSVSNLTSLNIGAKIFFGR